MAESTIERSVCGIAEKQGWLVRKVQWLGRRGAPDRLFMKGGRAVLIEFKRETKEPTTQQSREIKRLKNAGMEVYACDSIELGCEILGLKHVE